MDTDDNVYTLEHKGLLTVDKFLIAFCVGIIPGFFQILASKIVLTSEAKHWAEALIYLALPALFCLLWHSFRWPVRLRVMDKMVFKAATAFADDLKTYADDVTAPKMFKAADALAKIKGPDGKSYVRTKEFKEAMLETLDSSFFKNPIVGNIIHAHAAKIAKANAEASNGMLDERRARLKQCVDVFSRYTRYWWVLGVAICSVKFLILLLG